MGSRATLLRAGAALAGASMLITLSAMPAGADTATGVLDPHGDQRGYTVKLHHNGTHNELTTLIGLKLADGATVQPYRIELDTRLDGKYPKMVERAWDGYPVKGSPFHANRDKVNWVLHHSYPAAEVDQLTAKVQAAGVAIEAGLTPQEAITATQAAIWHFSDNADLDLNDAVPGHPEAAKHVAKLYQYLTGKDNVGIGDQPNPALQVAPQEITSQAGKRVGPFKVTTNA